MINHPDCHWCKNFSHKDMCDDCINDMHIKNAHTSTQSFMIGRICFHNEEDSPAERGITMGNAVHILNDDWIKNLRDNNE